MLSAQGCIVFTAMVFYVLVQFLVVFVTMQLGSLMAALLVFLVTFTKNRVRGAPTKCCSVLLLYKNIIIALLFKCLIQLHLQRTEGGYLPPGGHPHQQGKHNASAAGDQQEAGMDIILYYSFFFRFQACN